LRSLVERIETGRLSATLIILVALSVVIGIVAGRNVRVDLKIIFYILILSNLMLVAYTLLMRNIAHGVVIYLYSLTFLNFYWRITLPGRFPDLDLPRLVFVFIWLVFLIESSLGGRHLLPRSKAELPMLAVVLVVLVSMLTIGKVQIRQMLNGYAIPYAMFIIAKNAFRRREDVRRFIYWFAIPLSIYFPVNHMFEHYRLRQFVFPRYILSPEVAGQNLFWGQRALGVFLQPVATGMAMVSMFILSLYGLSKLKGFLPRLVSVFITGITPVAVFFIYTRSVYLGFFNAMIVLTVLSKNLRKFGVVIILGIILGILANWENVTTEKREAGGLATKHSATQRLVLFETSLSMFSHRPFFGVGFMRFEEEARPHIRQVRSTALGYREAWMGKNLKQHNQFLNMLTEMGLAGFIPLVFIYYYIFRTFARAGRIESPTYDRDFVVVVWAVFAEYVTNVFFMEPRFFEFMNVLPFLLAGIVIGGYQRATLPRWNNSAAAAVAVKGV
jgi:O-antigen ligase